MFSHQDRVDRHHRIDANGAPDHLRHDDVILELSQHQIEQRRLADQRRPALDEPDRAGHGGGAQRPDQRNDLEEPADDRNRQGIVQVEEPLQADEGHERHQRNQEDLATDVVAQNAVDLASDACESLRTLVRQQAQRTQPPLYQHLRLAVEAADPSKLLVSAWRPERRWLWAGRRC